MTREEKWLLVEKHGGVPSPAFEADRERLARGEPLAYVIGWQPFLGLRIRLDSRPLIPRVETEWWMEQLISECGTPRTFLDLCAGSGAIGCAALARLPQARVSFGEIDPAHEATIDANMSGNGLDRSRADIRIGDLFGPFDSKHFDIIAANPPYIPAGRELDPGVASYEPHRALYAGPDGLGIIRRIAAELPERLAPFGEAWIEVDSPSAETAAELFRARGLSAAVRTDQFGKPRVVVVSFP